MTDTVLRSSDAVRQHVTAVVERLQHEYLPGGGAPPTSHGAATLARLRRAQGSVATLDPRALAMVLDGLPPEVQTRSSGPTDAVQLSRAERAVQTALTTYAVHQQSQREPQHARGVSLGAAVRVLARQRASLSPGEAVGGMDDNVVQRLHRVSTAQSPELRTNALRALVTLMRSAERTVTLDYGLLAQDLYWLQVPSGVHGVQLRWGRDLHRTERHTDEASPDSATSGTERPDPTTDTEGKSS